MKPEQELHRYKCWIPDRGETEAEHVGCHAVDGEQAAVMRAKAAYEATAEFDEMIVCVKGSQLGARVRTFHVEVQRQPLFEATEIRSKLATHG